MVGRVCVIGAGPSGLSVLSWINRKEVEAKSVPEVVCYEKQEDWGGLWNYSWRTGTDEYGETVHGSMYRYLWSNGPKECLEFPYYTFEEHYGKPIPSFPPRDVLFQYLQGKWNKEDVKKYIRFRTVVRNVCYNAETDDFTVSVKDLVKDEVLPDERFDYVVVSTGHFSVPNIPDFQGLDRFPGRVLHAHDFRDAHEFVGKRLLVVGASYSAEDIALQCLKYGAKEIIISWRSHPMGFDWPDQISERPLVEKVAGQTVFFKDGSAVEVDVVLLCTGYIHSYPFLREELRLKSRNLLYPSNLYKGIVWQRGGNYKLLYVGAQDQAYTFTMFDVCGLWVTKLILGEINLPDSTTMHNDWTKWAEKLKKLEGSTDHSLEVDFQTEYLKELVRDCGADYPWDIDVSEIFHAWLKQKEGNILTYRDQSYTSKYTGTKSPVHHTRFMQALDDSFETFMNQTI